MRANYRLGSARYYTTSNLIKQHSARTTSETEHRSTPARERLCYYGPLVPVFGVRADYLLVLLATRNPPAVQLRNNTWQIYRKSASFPRSGFKVLQTLHNSQAYLFCERLLTDIRVQLIHPSAIRGQTFVRHDSLTADTQYMTEHIQSKKLSKLRILGLGTNYTNLTYRSRQLLLERPSMLRAIVDQFFAPCLETSWRNTESSCTHNTARSHQLNFFNLEHIQQ